MTLFRRTTYTLFYNIDVIQQHAYYYLVNVECCGYYYQLDRIFKVKNLRTSTFINQFKKYILERIYFQIILI